MRRELHFAVLGLVMMGLGAILIALAWPDSILPDCADPGDLTGLIDYYECTDNPVREHVVAFLPATAAALMPLLGMVAVLYGVRRHPV